MVIIMKYESYRSSGNRKKISAFYIVAAICLVFVGALTWYTAHGIRTADDHPGTASSDPAPRQEKNPIASDEIGEAAGNAVKDQPYNEPAVPSEEVAQEEATQVFVVPVEGEILKGYSDHELQYSATYGDMRLHNGTDIFCEEGVKVSAASSGTVLSVEETAELGNVISIDHGNGLITRYASIKDPQVKAGDPISAGDIIGAVTTVPGECDDRPHLHFEVQKNGEYTDPATLFQN